MNNVLSLHFWLLCAPHSAVNNDSVLTSDGSDRNCKILIDIISYIY